MEMSEAAANCGVRPLRRGQPSAAMLRGGLPRRAIATKSVTRGSWLEGVFAYGVRALVIDIYTPMADSPWEWNLLRRRPSLGWFRI